MSRINGVVDGVEDEEQEACRVIWRLGGPLKLSHFLWKMCKGNKMVHEGLSLNASQTATGYLLNPEMVKLNADLIWKSPHFFNAIKERELDLRGNKIAYIENLGATEDQFDTIDLSDNEIVKLENFPYLNRLGTLLLNNNRITRINPNIGEYLPKLHTLVLTNNRLVNLVEIDPLASISKLKFLSLLDNNITKKPNYRLYVIYKLKSLRVLDFKKVKQKEREEADKLFSSKEAEEEAKKVVKTITSEESPIVEEVSKEEQAPKAPTPEQIIAIKVY
uniref:Uncharacterized protein n=1 Tax=Chenopodium quinoa TaxID=63459 RepID=A0A803LXS5_CHEQI